jgi:hypothetical protein
MPNSEVRSSEHHQAARPPHDPRNRIEDIPNWRCCDGWEHHSHSRTSDSLVRTDCRHTADLRRWSRSPGPSKRARVAVAVFCELDVADPVERRGRVKSVEMNFVDWTVVSQ